MSDFSSHNMSSFTAAPAGYDALRDYTLARMEVGAQIQRVPIILLLDIPVEQTTAFEPFLRSFLDWLYAFKFDQSLRNSQCRISLSIMSTSEGGSVLLPPRLLSNFPGSGLNFFHNCSWIERPALDQLLFPLYNGTPFGMAPIRQIFNAFFADNGPIPPAFAVGNGDSPCFVILMTGKEDAAHEVLWSELTDTEVFQAKCPALCIWRPLEPPHGDVVSPRDGLFLAAGALESGLGETMQQLMNELANQINYVYLHAETLRPKGKNFFPDVVLPCLRGTMPAVTLSDWHTHGYALVPLVSVLEKSRQEINHLSFSLLLKMPGTEEIDDDGLQLVFTAPSDVFIAEKYSLTPKGSFAVNGFRSYLLTFFCAPAQSWDCISTGLNFRATLTCKTSIWHNYEVTLLGHVWMPPTSSHSYAMPVPPHLQQSSQSPSPQPPRDEGTPSDKTDNSPASGDTEKSRSSFLPWGLCAVFSIMFLVTLGMLVKSQKASAGNVKDNAKDDEIVLLKQTLEDLKKQLTAPANIPKSEDDEWEKKYQDLNKQYEADMENANKRGYDEGMKYAVDSLEDKIGRLCKSILRKKYIEIEGEKDKVGALGKKLEEAQKEFASLNSLSLKNNPSEILRLTNENKTLVTKLKNFEEEENKKLQERNEELNGYKKENDRLTGENKKLRKENEEQKSMILTISQKKEELRKLEAAGKDSPASNYTSSSVLMDIRKQLKNNRREFFDGGALARNCNEATKVNPQYKAAIQEIYRAYAEGRDLDKPGFLQQFEGKLEKTNL